MIYDLTAIRHFYNIYSYVCISNTLYHIITQISVTIIHSIDLPHVQTSMSRHTDSAVYVGWDPTPSPGITDDKVN